jgi:hypothetical protein
MAATAKQILFCLFIVSLLLHNAECFAQEKTIVKEIKEDYLTNSWIVIKQTVNDIRIPADDCKTFFHDDGKWGTYCAKDHILNTHSGWRIKNDKLIIESEGQIFEYSIPEKTATTMTLEITENEDRVRLYCVWKARN